MEVLKQKVQKLEVQEPELCRERLEGILVVLLGALGGGEGEGDLAILRGEGKRSLPFHPQKPMNTFTAFFTKSCPVAILGGQGNISVSEVFLCWFSRSSLLPFYI